MQFFLWWRQKSSVTQALFRNLEIPPLLNILQTLLSDIVLSKVNCGEAQLRYLGRVSVCKKEESCKEERGFESAALLWIGWETMGWKRKRKKHISGLCILAGCAKQSRKEVSITSSAEFFFSFHQKGSTTTGSYLPTFSHIWLYNLIGEEHIR